MRLAKLVGRWLAAMAILFAAVFTAGLWYPLPLPPPGLPPGALLVINARLIDLETGEVIPDSDIRIDGDRITEVGLNLAARDAVVLDAAGRYALPGLFDMHMHSLRMAPLLTHPLYIANGVTAVRDMGGCLGEFDSWTACASDKREWNREVREGKLVGPRYDQVTSLAINGGSEIPSGRDSALGAPDPAGARRRAAHDARRGIDFLKPYSQLDRESYFALAAAARDEGLYLAGHRPLPVSAADAIAAGQRSIEHAFLFIWECFPGRADLRRLSNPRDAYTHEMRRETLATHSDALCDELFEQMRAAGTAFVPTHTTRKLDAYALDPAFRNDSRLRYVAAPLRAMWLADADGMATRTSEDGLQSYRAFYEFGLEQTGKAHRAGVTVLAGSDSPDSFAFPGFALHDELQHLVMAGFSPLDALRAATLDPARYLGLAGEAGVIRSGARADIILLDENPLADIEALQTIDTVIVAGSVYDRRRLDELLQGVESASNHWSMWPKFIWQAAGSPILRAQFKD